MSHSPRYKEIPMYLWKEGKTSWIEWGETKAKLQAKVSENSTKTKPGFLPLKGNIEAQWLEKVKEATVLAWRLCLKRKVQKQLQMKSKTWAWTASW